MVDVPDGAKSAVWRVAAIHDGTSSHRRRLGVAPRKREREREKREKEGEEKEKEEKEEEVVFVRGSQAASIYSMVISWRMPGRAYIDWCHSVPGSDSELLLLPFALRCQIPEALRREDRN